MSAAGDHILRIARLFDGEAERVGPAASPLLAWLHHLYGLPAMADPDELPWCGLIMRWWADLAGLPHPSLFLGARHWLTIGEPTDAPEPGDLVILARGPEPWAPASVLDAPGHVGLWLGERPALVDIFGGNQGDRVCARVYPRRTVLGYRAWE